MGIILSNIYNTAKNLPTAAPLIKAKAVGDAVVTGIMANAGAQSAGAPGAIIVGGIFAVGCFTLTSVLDAHERAHRAKQQTATLSLSDGPA